MGNSSNDRDSVPKKPDNSPVILLLGDIADTTWRMFIPTIGCIGLGLFADTKLNAKPWCTILGIIVGILITSLLIRSQLKKVA